MALEGDVADFTRMEEIVTSILDRRGRIDILAINAGIPVAGADIASGDRRDTVQIGVARVERGFDRSQGRGVSPL